MKKYNPLGSTFYEGHVKLRVERTKGDRPTCEGCWYVGEDKKTRKRNYSSSCHIHGHVCTPINRKDRKQVIFVKVE